MLNARALGLLQLWASGCREHTDQRTPRGIPLATGDFTGRSGHRLNEQQASSIRGHQGYFRWLLKLTIHRVPHHPGTSGFLRFLPWDLGWTSTAAHAVVRGCGNMERKPARRSLPLRRWHSRAISKLEERHTCPFCWTVCTMSLNQLHWCCLVCVAPVITPIAVGIFFWVSASSGAATSGARSWFHLSGLVAACTITSSTMCAAPKPSQSCNCQLVGEVVVVGRTGDDRIGFFWLFTAFVQRTMKAENISARHLIQA